LRALEAPATDREDFALSDQETATTTEVEIFGATYVIRGGREPDDLTRLAAEVDRRMKELAEHMVSPEAGRLAILTALNLADELSRIRSTWDGERGEIEAKVNSLVDGLTRALELDGASGKSRRTKTKSEKRDIP